jgi:3alpha(or 20beta)-hydroxysteroid dehydrogenase
MGKLDGKVAIITGGARGQGEAHARLFVEEGASVVIGDVLDDDGQRVAGELGDAARYVHLDVSRAEDWDNAVAVAESMGPLRVVVNNAAIHWTRPIEYETADGFERIWRVNLLGPFLGIKAVIEPMRRAGGGSIVNISSTAGLTGYAYHGAYGSAKWGMRGLTRTAAVELGRDGIRVNSIHPGPINTSMMTRSPGIEETDFDERFQHLPARRCGEPREVAQLVVFLASDDSAFITGTEHTIDGGSMAGPPVTFRWDPALHDKGPK